MLLFFFTIPFTLQHLKHMASARLEPLSQNYWFAVFDFNDDAKTGKNWKLIAKEEEEGVWAADGCKYSESTIPRVLAGSIALPGACVPGGMQSFKLGTSQEEAETHMQQSTAPATGAASSPVKSPEFMKSSNTKPRLSTSFDEDSFDKFEEDIIETIESADEGGDDDDDDETEVEKTLRAASSPVHAKVKTGLTGKTSATFDEDELVDGGVAKDILHAASPSISAASAKATISPAIPESESSGAFHALSLSEDPSAHAQVVPAPDLAGAKVQTFTASDGRVFTDRREYRKHEFEISFTFKNKSGGDKLLTLKKDPGSIDGQPFEMAELTRCEVLLMDHSEAVQADYLLHCRVFIAAACDSVFVRNCTGCTFTIACKQLRTRDCKDCTFYLYSLTEPVIELSSEIRFAPFNGAYAEVLLVLLEFC